MTADDLDGPRPSRLRTIARHDVPASLVVFLVAVPLSLGIAVAPGAPIMSSPIAATIDFEVDVVDHAAQDALAEWTRRHEATGGTVAVVEAGTAALAEAGTCPPRRVPRTVPARAARLQHSCG